MPPAHSSIATTLLLNSKGHKYKLEALIYYRIMQRCGSTICMATQAGLGSRSCYQVHKITNIAIASYYMAPPFNY